MAKSFIAIVASTACVMLVAGTSEAQVRRVGSEDAEHKYSTLKTFAHEFIKFFGGKLPLSPNVTIPQVEIHTDDPYAVWKGCHQSFVRVRKN